MITVIAEKPSVGKELAQFLGATNKKEGYLEGNGYYVTWAYGHLLEIKDFKELGFSGEWKISNLPFIPKEYALKLKNDPGARKQFKIISELFQNSNEVICATDAGREGELIFRYIYEFSKAKSKIQRLWVSSLTHEALSKAFKNLKDGSEYIHLYEAAKARNQADYLVGLNATIGLTSKSQIGLLSLGRVQTPTLALICQRYIENKAFTPTPYFSIKVGLSKLKDSFWATSKDNYQTKEQATAIFNLVDKSLEGTITKIETKDKTEQPPLLFDLTSLQMEANKKYSMTANETLETAQALYENKHITYPRTGSCYIGEDLINEIPDLIKSLENYPEFNTVVKNFNGKKLNRKSVNGNKVTDHHALLITNLVPKSFKNQNEKQIYELIAGRMLEAFSEECIKEITSVELVVNEIDFTSIGTIIKKPGWRLVQQVEEDNLENQKLPLLTLGEVVAKTNTILNELYTKPKPLHTEASILNAMETCGKTIEDEELKQSLKESGIGTPATRASIIETLIKRNYIVRDKKNIIPSPLGLQVYDFVKEIDISKVELTGQWENKLLKMERGEYSYSEFQIEIEKFTHHLISLIQGSENKIEKNSIGICKCGGAIVESQKAYQCEQAKIGKCESPIVWKVIGNKTIPMHEVLNLFQKSKTGLIKGFKNKEDKPFDGALIIIDNRIVYDFTPTNFGKCPKPNCSGHIVENQKSFSCDNYKNTGCDFTIWKAIAGVTINKKIVELLITKKPTPLFKFKSQSKEFQASLALDANFKVVFAFK